MVPKWFNQYGYMFGLVWESLAAADGHIHTIFIILLAVALFTKRGKHKTNFAFSVTDVIREKKRVRDLPKLHSCCYFTDDST